MIKIVMFKSYVQKKLENYVRAYLKAHADIKLVIVTGSVGKTTTKLAIATVLAERLRVRAHNENHNSEISAPLAVLGIEYPKAVRNPLVWLSVFKAAKLRISQSADVDVIVQEIGSDRPGQVAHAGTYLHPDIAVVTAVSPEHMKYFGDIDTVAREELAAANYSQTAIINRDDIDGRYAELLTNSNISTYGSSASAEYYFIEDDFTLEGGYTGKFVAKDWDDQVDINLRLLGDHSVRPAVAAGAVAVKLGLNSSEVSRGLSKINPVPGRMNVLHGVDKTIIIDDTYNSSPLAATSALKTLYMLSVPQRIAVLGSMNELGDSSEAEHQALGKLCDPSQLAWVVTVGEEAEKFLAPSARQQGCQVKSFRSAIDAGSFVHKVLEPGAAILFKGSQTDIYLEEAVKVVLRSARDAEQLVRQSPTWFKKKSDFFSS